LRDLTVMTSDGVALSCEQSGEGPAIVLLHGLTATRRYVVMGSKALERAGLRTIAYDARGHGRSDPAPTPDAYAYERLAADLGEVLDALGVERAALAGVSMGAQTAIRFALDHADRVAALGLITPAYDPETHDSPGGYAGWDALADGLRKGGVDGFLAAYDFESLPPAWRETVQAAVEQRLAQHAHPDAVADALEAVPRSRPFQAIAELARLQVPTVVIATRDEADPGHPLAVAERYAAAIAGAGLLVEEPGHPPLAWQGGRLSKVLLDLVAAGGAADGTAGGAAGGAAGPRE
jgi:pimeloyl-ACP methyl ester carboxylesterase